MIQFYSQGFCILPLLWGEAASKNGKQADSGCEILKLLLNIIVSKDFTHSFSRDGAAIESGDSALILVKVLVTSHFLCQ